MKWFVGSFITGALIFVSLNNFLTVEENKAYVFPELDFFPEMPESPENPVSVFGVELGRYLFYDPILSRDSTISCATCHQQANAFTDSPIRFSKGIQKTELSRNTMPLFNLAWYDHFFWDGKATEIETQVYFPVRAHDEMGLDWPIATKRIEASDFYQAKFQAVFGRQTIDSVLIAKAIAQFERILISHNSKYDRVLRGELIFSPDEYEGFILINDQTKGDCLHCHTTDADALGTNLGFSNNGLNFAEQPEDYPDAGRGGITGERRDFGNFKIPSLRNVALTAPYMHDGRFSTLEEVIDFYSDSLHYSYNLDPKMRFIKGGRLGLSEDEKSKIITFLHTLTDSVFISNPAFSNPFLEN